MEISKFLKCGLCAMAGVVAIVSVLLVLPHKAATFMGQGSKKTQPEERKMPVASYSSSEAIEERERGEKSLRRIRNLRHDKKGSQRFDEYPDDTVERGKSTHWWFDLPGLPTGESDAVIVGMVTDARGYLSSDRTGAYSEFTVLIEDIYKNDSRLSNGSSIIAEREGASVKLPDGRTISYKIIGQGMPQIARRVALFLKYDEEAKSYNILTGYELIDKRVYPLDEEVERFAAFKLDAEDSFLEAIREAVTNPPQLLQDRRRPGQ